jgi:hypothetical protein
MVLPKLSTIYNLAIFGGLGAAVTPFITPLIGLSIWFMPFYYFSGLGIALFLLMLLIGILACVMAARAADFVSKMPQRAASDLKAAGILVIVVGIISFFNVLFILFGILLLATGVETDSVWKNIQQARIRTGWPFQTVATATGNPWTRQISCRFCGAPMVVLNASARGHLVHFETQCPLDKTHDSMKLPLSRLDSWTPVVADRLHRCQKCGDRTAGLIVVGQSGMSTSLQAYCIVGHRNSTYRRVWTPLYPHVARIPSDDVGFQGRPTRAQFQPTFHESHRIPKTQTISSSISVVTHRGPIGFCTQCGAKVESSDIYCFRCGHQIR